MTLQPAESRQNLHELKPERCDRVVLSASSKGCSRSSARGFESNQRIQASQVSDCNLHAALRVQTRARGCILHHISFLEQLFNVDQIRESEGMKNKNKKNKKVVRIFTFFILVRMSGFVSNLQQSCAAQEKTCK